MNIEVKDIEQMVFVATCPRSGSSMDCGIMEICGAFGGDTMGVVPANEKGIFENRGLNVLAMAPIFDRLGIRNPKGLLTIHKMGGAPAELFDWLRQDLAYGLNRQGYTGGVAYYKSGIYTFFFDRINEVFPDAVWVLPKRDREGVFASTKRIRPMQPQQQIVEEIDAYMEMYGHIQQAAQGRVFTVDNDAVVKGDHSTIKAVVDHLGLEWKPDEVKAFIDKDAWGNTDEFKTPQMQMRGNRAGNRSR